MFMYGRTSYSFMKFLFKSPANIWFHDVLLIVMFITNPKFEKQQNFSRDN